MSDPSPGDESPEITRLVEDLLIELAGLHTDYVRLYPHGEAGVVHTLQAIDAIATFRRSRWQKFLAAVGHIPRYEVTQIKCWEGAWPTPAMEPQCDMVIFVRVSDGRLYNGAPWPFEALPNDDPLDLAVFYALPSDIVQQFITIVQSNRARVQAEIAEYYPNEL